MAKKEFETLLIEAVDEALTTLGDSVKESIYYHLEDSFRIAKSEIPQRVEDFTDGLEKIFGVGAQFLEILIMKKLYERIGQPLEWNKDKELVFAEYVATARRSFLRERKRS